MDVFIVVENPKRWPLDIPGTEVVSAREYLTDPRFVGLGRAKVFNLCRAYGYQTTGYYVSLLAAARGHKPMPSVATIQDLRESSLLRIVAEDLDDILQHALAPIKHDSFQLSIYFGRNLAKRYDRLAQALFGHFPAPLLRAEFVHLDRWRLQNLRVIATKEIPETHRDFVMAQAQRFFARPRVAGRVQPRYDLAILYDPTAQDSPSDDIAIHRFTRAAKNLGMRTTMIGKQDYGRIPEFDALFIRETTRVDHHTYRFARRGEAEGLIVIDDSESIVRCSNKVFQAEVFVKHKIPCPKTLIVHKGNMDQVGSVLGFPCVLKRPDSSFSSGVEKASNEAELAAQLETFFRDSELVVAQEFLPSNFDWRVGVLCGKALYVCKYHMARGHWQIRKGNGADAPVYGKVETLAVGAAPPEVVKLGVKAAGLIGQGLYGVDIKEVDGRYAVVEINDNPNIDGGYEDSVIKGELYDAIMRHFYERIEQRGQKWLVA